MAAADEALIHLLRQAGRPSFFRLLQEAGGVSIDRPAYAILVRVAELAPVRLTDLADAVGSDISTVSRQVRALEQAGMLTRSADPTDQRAFRLALSDAGCETVQRAREARRAALSGLLGEWTSEEVTVLAALMERLARGVAALTAAGPQPERGTG